MISAKDLKEVSFSLNVLYVEDEEILRENMQNTLSKLFANMYVAKNGQEAFEIYKKENIDLVITDINMPIMDGIELIQQIHHHHADYEASITVLSAYNESRLLIRLINLGIDNFINKPVDKQMLINSLYKTCKAIVDKKLLVEYEMKLQHDFDAMVRKNNVLQQKINQLAIQTNKNTKQKSSNASENRKEEEYYKTLLVDDKEELHDLAVDLDDYIVMLFEADRLNSDYLPTLSSVYKKYASIINTYPEFHDISNALYKFSQTILTLEDKFMKDLNQTGVFFESLHLTLENFRQNIWMKEAKNPRFYNASLIIDIQLVTDFLEGKEVKDNEIEFF